MSFTSLLINTCDVERFTLGVADSYGNPIKTWAVVINDEPCRLMDAGGREIQIGAEVVIADNKLFIANDDITERDRIVILGKTYEILLVETRQDSVSGHHLELLLRLVR